METDGINQRSPVPILRMDGTTKMVKGPGNIEGWDSLKKKENIFEGIFLFPSLLGHPFLFTPTPARSLMINNPSLSILNQNSHLRI